MRNQLAFMILAVASALLPHTASAAALECPVGPPTAETLEAFRLTAATALLNGSIAQAKIAKKITECFPTAVPACMQRSLDYATRFDTASSNDDVAIADSPEKRPPDEFLVPGAAGLQYMIPAQIEQIAAEKGWPVVRYKSRHAGGFDAETPSLLMVLVPGDKMQPPVTYDRWLNFAIPKDNGADALKPTPQVKLPTVVDYAAELTGGISLPHTFTMVTLDKREGTTAAKVYFQMFSRNQTGSPAFLPQPNASVDSCYSCHPNGLRAISPLGYHVRAGEAQLGEKEWLAVKTINDAMTTGEGGKSISWRDAKGKQLLKPKAQGPIIGATTPLNATGRTKAFIQSCTALRTTVSVVDIFGRDPGLNNVYKLSAAPQVRWDKVASAMNCETCHNNKIRGALNDATDFSQIDFKILVDQSMPLGVHQNPLDQDGGTPTTPVVDDLTGDERIALANCLSAEFELERQELVKWLSQTACQ